MSKSTGTTELTINSEIERVDELRTEHWRIKVSIDSSLGGTGEQWAGSYGTFGKGVTDLEKLIGKLNRVLAAAKDPFAPGSAKILMKAESDCCRGDRNNLTLARLADGGEAIRFAANPEAERGKLHAEESERQARKVEYKAKEALKERALRVMFSVGQWDFLAISQCENLPPTDQVEQLERALGLAVAS